MREIIQLVINQIEANSDDLHEISLAEQNVDDIELASILQALTEHPKVASQLTEFDFYNNNITTFDASNINLPLLKILDLSCNNVTVLKLPANLKAIERILLENKEEKLPRRAVQSEARRVFTAVGKVWQPNIDSIFYSHVAINPTHELWLFNKKSVAVQPSAKSQQEKTTEVETSVDTIQNKPKLI